MTARSIVAKWPAWSPPLLSMLRIAGALIFIQFGTMKLFAFPAGVPPKGGTVALLSQAGVAGALEVFGGAFLLVGLFTRPVAFLLSGEMAVAYFQFHQPRGLWPVLNGGVQAALYCWVWFYISAAGAGPWSLDAWRRRRSAASSPAPRGSSARAPTGRRPRSRVAADDRAALEREA